ncbi:hypothetical protein [Spirosoma endophyticum]|uniref:Uncharacterized protein n=1 Tax=Spirosoma endophyticum TaxID=662367 RepID=A0A1I1X939_9BACT|nr:hypothetical protein [Spirosoma endophyticum]SFE03936.1 hypothetical protein SAMN05216167_109215 [Spirosoma endophyticum]
METPNDPQQFDYRIWLSNGLKTEIDILFEKAIGEFSEKPWFKTSSAEDWKEILPFPVPCPEKSWSGRYSQAYAKWIDDEKQWEIRAAIWLDSKKKLLRTLQDQAKKLLPYAVKIINAKYKIHLKPDNIFSTWIESVIHLPLYEFEKIIISVKNVSSFLSQQANQYENRNSEAGRPDDSSKAITVTKQEVELVIKAAQQAKIDNVPFSDLLINFSIEDLDALLVHLKIKDTNGNTTLLNGKKANLHEVITALEGFDLLKEVTRKKKYNSLCLYLGMTLTRTKNGHLTAKNTTRAKAVTYLKQNHLNQK